MWRDSLHPAMYCVPASQRRKIDAVIVLLVIVAVMVLV